ncbi:uncharacterized protein LOC136086670 isoform X2 [Hydra vulgaris]|uniref:Uncharacterized protein LOC136086670 isoform X2 n=1 Tax=Hydra vulgaris TaxID=6087 RepID=A0ABM4CST0_HYDVU
MSNLPLVLPSLQPSQSTLISSITFSESSVSVNSSHLMKAANEAFVSANSIKTFLAQHPSTCQYTEEVDSGKVSISTRQHIIRVVVHKMISACGSYPDRYQKISVAALLSEALVLPACIFYDSTNRHGFLERGLENARRKLPGSQKKFVWSHKKRINSTRCDTTQLADPELAELSQPAGHSVELQNPKRMEQPR